ncbi:DUF2892 domain-containing protein [Candidatus Woesearchaeota archaeon]|nr:DUF2892 domain-containing protein [Candidatus Woesearchaeota archaeon]
MERPKLFSPNESKADRIIRVIIGLVFIALGYIYSPWLYIIAAISLITAADGFCLVYWILGISTKKTNNKKQN